MAVLNIMIVSAPEQIWSASFGGTGTDIATSVVNTADGGFFVVGYTDSFGAGGFDIVLLRYDSTGNLLWNKTIGGADYDFAESVVQTSDGGFAVAGRRDVAGTNGYDAVLIKTDPAGSELWSKFYGGTGIDGPWLWFKPETEDWSLQATRNPLEVEALIPSR